MRKVLFAVAATAAFAATPALANELRVEARGGAVWADGDTEDTYGAAIGYDIDFDETAFVGFEVSGDKIATSGTKVAFGFNTRLGARLGEKTKLYGTVGYATEPCDACEGNFNAGAGIEYALSGKVYGKVEYRRYFGETFSDSNAAVVGVGIRF